MRRQGLIVTISQLIKLVNELEKEEFNAKYFQINIINKTPECSDTWEIETPKFPEHQEHRCRNKDCKFCKEFSS